MGWQKRPMLSSDTATRVFCQIIVGIMNLGFKTLLLEMTGQQALQHTVEKGNLKDILAIVEESLKSNKMVICMAEG